MPSSWVSSLKLRYCVPLPKDCTGIVADLSPRSILYRVLHTLPSSLKAAKAYKYASTIPSIYHVDIQSSSFNCKTTSLDYKKPSQKRLCLINCPSMILPIKTMVTKAWEIIHNGKNPPFADVFDTLSLPCTPLLLLSGLMSHISLSMRRVTSPQNIRPSRLIWVSNCAPKDKYTESNYYTELTAKTLCQNQSKRHYSLSHISSSSGATGWQCGYLEVFGHQSSQSPVFLFRSTPSSFLKSMTLLHRSTGTTSPRISYFCRHKMSLNLLQSKRVFGKLSLATDRTNS